MNSLKLSIIYFQSKNVSTLAVKSKSNVISALQNVNLENQYEMLADIVTPLWRMPYSEQLLMKKKSSLEVLSIIKSKNLPKVKTKLHQIIPSPQVDAYRNKDEFSVRMGVDKNPKVVGFFIGSPAEDEVICVPPLKLKNIRPNHIEIAQNFIESSPLQPCYNFHDKGFWRNLLVRSNNIGHTMVVVCVHPLGASEEITDMTKECLTEYFKCNSNLKSLYFQACPHTRCTSEQAPFQLMYGEPYIYETIGTYTFRISPDSFFQVNTEALPSLYESALNFAGLNKKLTLLDLCCGTGVLSIFASQNVRGCVGIDHVRQAIEDANFNANTNNVENCNFVCGRIEKELSRILSGLDSTPDLVAVVNPGRDGIHKTAVKVLRRCVQLKRLVYISCKPDSPNTMNNFINLCSHRYDSSKPFYLTDIQPVDMFPHTSHCELVMLFKR